jgi:hypothetical protein
MARKNKNLASFDELASTTVLKDVAPKNSINNGVNIDVNNGINVNANNSEDVENKPSVIANANVNADVNDKAAVNVNVDEKHEDDYLDKLIGSNGKKSTNESVLVGIYLQKDLSQILDKLAKKGGRGAKSRIVNEALRAIFKEKGLL